MKNEDKILADVIVATITGLLILLFIFAIW